MKNRLPTARQVQHRGDLRPGLDPQWQTARGVNPATPAEAVVKIKEHRLDLMPISGLDVEGSNGNEFTGLIHHDMID